MATVYDGNRSFYEEGGRFYSGEDKQIEYDPVTYAVLTDEKTETVIEPPVVKEPPVVEDAPVINKCDVCGFVAKSFAGLSVHKTKHKDEVVDEDTVSRQSWNA